MPNAARVDGSGPTNSDRESRRVCTTRQREKLGHSAHAHARERDARVTISARIGRRMYALATNAERAQVYETLAAYRQRYGDSDDMPRTGL